MMKTSSENVDSKKPTLKSLSKKRWILLTVPALTMLVLFYLVPLMLMSLTAFYQYVPGVTMYDRVFTLENFVHFFSEPAYVRVLTRTLALAAGSTLGAVLIAYPVSYRLARSGAGVLPRAIIIIIMLTVYVGVIPKCYAWMLILMDYGIVNNTIVFLGLPKMELLNTDLAVMLSLMHFAFPFAVLSLVAAIQNIDPNLEKAAEGLGAGRIRTFVKIIFPLSLPGILSATLLCYTMSMNAFVSPIMLGGGKVDMLSNLIYDRYIFTMNYPFGSAMGIILLILSLTVAYGLQAGLMRYVRV